MLLGQESGLSLPARLGRSGTFTWTGRHSFQIANVTLRRSRCFSRDKRGDVSARPPDALQVRSQGSAVRSLREHGVTWVSFTPIPDRACAIDFTLRKFPELGLLSGTVRGVCHEHARRDSGDGDDDFSFHINLKGLSFVDGGRGPTTLREGDGMLLSYSASRTISRPDLVDHRVVRVPRAVLGPLVRNADDFVLRRIPRGTGMLNLLKGYIDEVFDDPALGMPEMRPLIAGHLGDLIAVTLGATRDAAAVAKGRGIRAARLRAIKHDIEVHLTSADLSIDGVANRQKISNSYVRKLFESERNFSRSLL